MSAIPNIADELAKLWAEKINEAMEQSIMDSLLNLPGPVAQSATHKPLSIEPFKLGDMVVPVDWINGVSEQAMLVPATKASPPLTCECGAEKTFGIGGAHSIWCPASTVV